ncbi:MAG: hypothetical protein ISF22_08485 [Methanomassiliicoccus sp.]|nr:hypothetical protein [Methanomassiliicoccus sp.]
MVFAELGLSSIALVLLFILGLGILILIIKLLILFIPGIIIAAVTWYITQDAFLTGVAFIAITVLMIIFKR